MPGFPYSTSMLIVRITFLAMIWNQPRSSLHQLRLLGCSNGCCCTIQLSTDSWQRRGLTWHGWHLTLGMQCKSSFGVLLLLNMMFLWLSSSPGVRLSLLVPGCMALWNKGGSLTSGVCSWMLPVPMLSSSVVAPTCMVYFVSELQS